MEFSSDMLLVCICLAMFVSTGDTAVIRSAKPKVDEPLNKVPCKMKVTSFPHPQNPQGSFDVEIFLDCKNDKMDLSSEENDDVIESGHHSICYYVILPLALISCLVLALKAFQKIKKRVRFFRFTSVSEENGISQSLQQTLSDMENGKLEPYPSATPEVPESKNLVNDATLATQLPSPVAPISPKDLPTVLSEGDSLLKAAFLSGPYDQGHLWYADHTQVFQQVTVDNRDNNKQMFESDGACKYETLQKPTQMDNPVYKLLEDIILPDDTFGYDEEVDAINHIYSMDDFLGFKHLGVMPYY